MPTLRQLLDCDIYDGQEVKIGVIDDVLWDKSEKKGLIKTESGIYEADKIRLTKCGVFASVLLPSEAATVQIADKAAYDSDGKRLGTVTDAEFTSTMKLSKIICDNGEQYNKGRVSAVDDIVLIKTEKPAKASKKRTKAQTDICANAQPTASKPAAAAAYPVKRRYGDFSFLIGKTADKNIKNFFGEVMIRRGEKVTADTLRQAKISGKLIELCLHVF